ncbi:MAG: hypothetical protein IJT26_04850 [Bacteroidales bacterium]|nr:hypothetical protein [Bacteroidales bacterium]
MQFAQVTGNGHLKALLAQMVDNNRLPHAILLTEDDAWGAMPLAIALAQYVNCENPSGGDSCGVCDSCHKYGKLIHPDLHFVFPVAATKGLTESEKKAGIISDYFLDSFRQMVLRKPYFDEQDLYDAIEIENKSGSICVAEAKRLTEKLSLRAFEGKYKTVIIYLPEKMNQDTANKLLKLIEEPPAGTLFIMVSHAPERIISTIRSRCQLIRLQPLTRKEKEAAGIAARVKPEYRELLIQLLNAGIAKSVIDTFPVWEALADMVRERQKEWCLYAESYIRKIYMTASGLEGIADLDGEEADTVRAFAARIKPSFYETAYKALEGAMASVDSNVNPKLTFCNLCNILLLSM